MGKPKHISALAGMGATGVDYNCSMSFSYGDESMSIMHSSVLYFTGVNAAINGDNGSIVFDNWWFLPVNFKVIDNAGNETPYKFSFVGNGYNYEVDEVVSCLNTGMIESKNMSWQDSLDLIDTLDQIRSKCGLVYESHDII